MTRKYNFDVEPSLHKCFEIFPKSSTNQNFWRSACTPFAPRSCTTGLRHIGTRGERILIFWLLIRIRKIFEYPYPNISEIYYPVQWCSRDRNLRDRDVVKISRRDRDFIKNSETETWSSRPRLQNLCILSKFFKKMSLSLLTMGVRRGGNGHFSPWDCN